MSFPYYTIPHTELANAGALKMEWPRIPLPGWPEGKAEGAAQDLAESADRGTRTGQSI